MDCRTLQSLVPFLRRPGELSAEDIAWMQQHLVGCAACHALVEQEQAFDQSVARAMHAVEVPVMLRDHIGVRLAQQNGRIIQRRVMQIAAIALLLMLGIGGTWLLTSRIVIHPAQLAEAEDSHFVLTFNRTISSAGEFFRSRGLRTQLPEELDYGLLSNMEVVEFRGHEAARLDFQNGDVRMKVYVLPRRHFRVAPGAPDDAIGSVATVEVVEASRDFLFVYVCFNGGNRQMFMPRSVVG